MRWRFITCAALFVTCLLTANTIAAKLIVVGGVVLTAGIETDFNPAALRG
jgi:hypothetical protein